MNGATVPVSTDEVTRLPIPDYRIVTGLAPNKMVSEQMGRNVKVAKLGCRRPWKPALAPTQVSKTLATGRLPAECPTPRWTNRYSEPLGQCAPLMIR
jgi:hypothetical protein